MMNYDRPDFFLLSMSDNDVILWCVIFLAFDTMGVYTNDK